MADVNLDGGGVGGGDDSDSDSSTDDTASTTDLDREIRRRLSQREPSGIDAGEPISGVDGDGSPRDDSESTPLEGGPGSQDGMGGSTGAVPTRGDGVGGDIDSDDDSDQEDSSDDGAADRVGDTGAIPTRGDSVGGTSGFDGSEDTTSELTDEEVQDGALHASQGAEGRDDQIGEQAREVEQQVVQESPFFESTDQVQIEFDEENMQFVPKPTAVGRAALQAGEVGSAVEFFSNQFGDAVDERGIEGVEIDDGQFSPILTDTAREDLVRDEFLSGGVHHGDDIPVWVEDADEFQRDVLRGKFDDEDFEFTATEDGVDISISESAIRDQLRRETPGEQSTRPQDDSDTPLPDRIGGLIADVRDEGLESVERGGALSEAGRDVVATTLGVGFQNTEELSEYVGISDERLAAKNVDISGPAVTALDTESEGMTIFEFERGDAGNVDESVLADLTAGQGLLSESQRESIREDIEQRRELLDFGEELGEFAGQMTDDNRVEGVATGVGRVPADLATATAHLTLGADTAVQVAPNVGSAVGEHGTGSVALTSLEVAGRGVENVSRAAEERPYEFAGSLGGAVVGGAIVGKAAGTTTRFTRDRVRTAGAETFDIRRGGVVNPETGQFFSPRSKFDDPDARFPGASDPSLYRSRPAEAVRRQADEFTPASVQRRFQEAGVTEGTTLKKALDVEPASPSGRRRGFATQEGSYESPGGFVGPELSPNFFRVGSRSSGFSFLPGLPDFGDSATGVLVRTRVDTPDARTMPEFRREMLAREGETAAFTKPRQSVNTGEIEAVIPPEAKFADIGGGVVRNTARRLGIGSDFAVRIGGRDVPFTDRTIGGRRIPLRPVADPDLVETGGRRNFGTFLSDERGQVGAGATGQPRTRQLSEIRSPIRDPVDRPVPVVPGTPSGGQMSGEPASSVRGASLISESVDSPTITPGFESRVTSPDSSELPYASSSAVASSVSEGVSTTTSGVASGGSRGVSGASSSAAGPSSSGPPRSPGSSFGASSSIGASSALSSSAASTVTPPSTGTPLARGFDFGIGRSKHDDAEFVAGEQQFIVPFAEPEDVVGPDRTFDLGF